MSTPVAAVSGLGAACLFALGTALQYRAARDVTASGAVGTGVGVRSGARIARATIASRRWLLGTASLAAGLSLHALALHNGPLTLVQPLLVTGVLFALPASRWTGGPSVTAGDMRKALALVAALSVFLLTSTPASQATHAIDRGPAATAFALSLAGIVACVLIARRCRGNVAAAALGTSSGIALAGSAALIKVSTDLLARGVGALVTSWQLYALVVVGSIALLLGQVAYRAGPMVASLPAINIANPLASIVIGVAVFDEHFRVGAVAVGVECVSLAVVLATAAALSLDRQESTARV